MKSVKSKILTRTLILVCSATLLIGISATLLNYNNTNSLLKQTMSETSKVAADRVAMELLAYSSAAIDAGCTPQFSDSTLSVAEKKAFIDQRAAAHKFERGNILGIDGKSIFDGTDFSERAYFKAAMEGKTYTSEPVLSKVTGKLAMIIAAPIWQNGIQNSKVVGCVYFAPTSTFLNDMVASIKISPNASSYIIDKNGNTIAHMEISRVESTENVENLAKENTSLSAIADIHSKMRAGESGFSQYTFNKVTKFSAYAPIANSGGWSIAVTAPRNDFMASSILSIVVTITLMIVAIIISTIVSTLFANSIANPIKACAARLALLAKGDLRTEVPEVKTNDETKLLADSTKTIVETTKGIIDDLYYGLSEIGNGNLTVDSKVKHLYTGDYAPLAQSVYMLITKLTQIISEISRSASEVSSGSDQVSSGAQALSQGATEQASSIEELSATMHEISNHIKQNAENSTTANSHARIVAQEIENGDRQMQNLAKAMSDINISSGEIGKIIKTIEDIAFQTNILALNAAVEAARAGAAGKGFAVVADEVRNLASKSAEAAKTTTALIEGSVVAVNTGTQMAQATADALSKITDGAKTINMLIEKISVSSDEQANSIAEVNMGVEQISAVIQTNSATAEESAAASEELNSQAAVLNNMMSTFTLAAENGEPTKSPSPKQSSKSPAVAADSGDKY